MFGADIRVGQVDSDFDAFVADGAFDADKGRGKVVVAGDEVYVAFAISGDDEVLTVVYYEHVVVDNVVAAVDA